jgi:hypothetical protein
MPVKISLGTVAGSFPIDEVFLYRATKLVLKALSYR